MATRKPSRRPGKARAKTPTRVHIGIEVPRPTKEKLDELKVAFATKAIAVLGLEADGSYTNQTPTTRRRSR